MTSVSFLVPLRNGAPWVASVIASIDAQADGRLMEIIVVDDDSTDASVAIVQSLQPACPLRLIRSDRRGAAAAINTGIRAAQFSVICQGRPGCRASPRLDAPCIGRA